MGRYSFESDIESEVEKFQSVNMESNIETRQSKIEQDISRLKKIKQSLNTIETLEDAGLDVSDAKNTIEGTLKKIAEEFGFPKIIENFTIKKSKADIDILISTLENMEKHVEKDGQQYFGEEPNSNNSANATNDIDDLTRFKLRLAEIEKEIEK